MHRLITLVTIAWLSGCGGAVADFCEEQCACEGCNANQREACELDVQAGLDEAEIYGCGEPADRLLECAVDNSTCNGADLENSCNAQGESLAICIDAARAERLRFDG